MTRLAIAASLILLPLAGSERVDIHNGRLPAPGAAHCIRLHADGAFERATVRVNDVNAGELGDSKSEIDITGYLSTGAVNTIEIQPLHGVVERVWAWMSPLVYISGARLDRAAGLLEVSVTNTTENTAQVDIGSLQFTVSPGTSATKQIPWSGERHVRMHAVSDGLDRQFIDEAEAELKAVERR